MGQALYRKYRSKNLAEIVGQEHITRALERAIKQKSISHAYLFTGPRGVGKTSIARILAHEVNSLPYTDESAHLDIIEIDAASNRRIDEVRDLREKVHIAPTSAQYKVYIIDEVHMLTREAFNALLKTLEEPPAHVIFILATTEMHKLPETIVSRTQHYAFKPIENEKVVAHLQDIAKREKIKIDDDALVLIAQHGDGSFRDSISLLDQIRNYADHIRISDVQAMLGIAPEESVANIVKNLSDGDAAQLVLALQELRNQGIETGLLSKQLGSYLRSQLLNNKNILPGDTVLAVMDKLVGVPASANPAAALEIALLGVMYAHSPVAGQSRASETRVDDIQIPKAEPVVASKPAPEDIPKAIAEESKPAEAVQTAPLEQIVASKKTSPKGDEALDEGMWTEVLTHIKQRYNTMYGVLRMAEPSFTGHTLTLAFQFPFHQKRVNDPTQKKIIVDAVKEISGKVIDLVCVVGTDKPGAPASKTSVGQKTAGTDKSQIGTISNIFGGGELLES